MSSFFRNRGHQVIRLKRHGCSDADSVFWDPEKGVVIKEELEGFDAVIHLAGENIYRKRWTKRQMRTILMRRSVPTFLLSHVLSQLYQPPKVFISPSMVGYYGHKGDEMIDEESCAGSGFLSVVCSECERASQSLEDRGCRVVRPRIGWVLQKEDCSFQKLLLLYRLGFGGKWGSGRQWVSWIAYEDVLSAFHFALIHENLVGAVNLVSPNSVRVDEFSDRLGEVIHRPPFFSYSDWFLRLIYGRQMVDELLLSGCRAVPAKLCNAGFTFQYPVLDRALLAILS